LAFPACCHRVDGALNDFSPPQRHGGVLDTYPLQLDGPGVGGAIGSDHDGVEVSGLIDRFALI
jgi:hypothetical protein